MKKEYEALEIEIREFATVDVMSVSDVGGVEDGGMPGENEDRI